MSADPQSTPVDIKTASAIVVAVGGLIVTVTSWLDRRSKTQRDEILAQHSQQIERLTNEVHALTERVHSLEDGQHEARAILCDALVMDDAVAIKQSVKKAIEALH